MLSRVAFILFLMLSGSAVANNQCKDTSLWFGAEPYVMPSKEELQNASNVYTDTKKLLEAGKAAQSGSCLTIVGTLQPKGKNIRQLADSLHNDFVDITVAAGHLSNCLACGSSSRKSCDNGIQQLSEAKIYIQCLKEKHYDIAD